MGETHGPQGGRMKRYTNRNRHGSGVSVYMYCNAWVGGQGLWLWVGGQRLWFGLGFVVEGFGFRGIGFRV